MRWNIKRITQGHLNLVQKIKTVFTLVLIISSWQAALGQQNVIKGRAFVLPTHPYPYSLGMGYERLVSQHFAVQTLFNITGYDGRSYDGSAENVIAMVPETKYYFNGEKISSSFYSAFFIELLKSRNIPSGVNDDSPKVTRKEINPGLLLGKNLRLGKKWHFELYAGVRYRYGGKEEDYLPLVSEDKSFQYRKWGIRIGINLANRF